MKSKVKTQNSGQTYDIWIKMQEVIKTIEQAQNKTSS